MFSLQRNMYSHWKLVLLLRALVGRVEKGFQRQWDGSVKGQKCLFICLDCVSLSLKSMKFDIRVWL